jgi:hypothetical protein
MPSPPMIRVPLHRLAHARAGDKGNRLNVAVFCYRPEHYSLLVEQITADAVARKFEHRRPASVVRYLVPSFSAINFVLDDVLEGGVNSSLTLDRHGKGLSFLLLELPVAIPAAEAELFDKPKRRQT